MVLLSLLNFMPVLSPFLALQHRVPRWRWTPSKAKYWDYFYGHICTDVSSSDGCRLWRCPICSNCLVCSLAVVARTPWELNHPAPPLCFAGLAELRDVVRLLLLVPQRIDWTCQQCPAVSRWQLAICVALLCSQSRAQGGCGEGWQLFSLAIPAMLNINLNHG